MPFLRKENQELRILVLSHRFFETKRQDPSLDLSTMMYEQERKGILKPRTDVADKTWKEVD